MGRAAVERSVAVLGGGLLGCCTALVLAERGARVVLYDRAERLIDRASLHNEGKIHLGYVYAGDSSLATARTMIRGALGFAPFLQRYLDVAPERVELSTPHVYLVHAASQRSLDYLAGYFAAVHDLIVEASAGKESAYFGVDLRKPPRRWSSGEVAAAFDPAKAVAAFDTEEIAVDPYALARAFRERVAAAPAIELRLGRTVTSVGEQGGRLRVTSAGVDGEAGDDYTHVVNALWDGRLAIDATRGIRPKRPWLHRFRYGVRIESQKLLEAPLSLTMVHGPFGGVVCYENGAAYMAWYPACRVETSSRLDPPDWPAYAGEPIRSRIIAETAGELAAIVPAIAAADPALFADATVVGGNIFAWGASDTDDPSSELHQRHDIGIESVGNYHSVDPGKLSLTPHFAKLCADRILPP